MKHYKSVDFLSIFKMPSFLHKRKACLLKTFWRRFCLDCLLKHFLEYSELAYIKQSVLLLGFNTAQN